MILLSCNRLKIITGKSECHLLADQLETTAGSEETVSGKSNTETLLSWTAVVTFIIFNPSSAGIVFIRQNQILTCRDGLRTERNMYNDRMQRHRYSNEPEKVNQNLYDGFKLKKNSMVRWFKQKDFSVVRVNPLTAKLFNLNFHPLEVVSR